MEKIDYISKKLKDTIFQTDNQTEIIKLVIEVINMTNNHKINLEYQKKLGWKTNTDTNLAYHLMFMYEKSKKIELNNINKSEFETAWNIYIMKGEYYEQILSYIVNADDYKYGDRFKLEASTNEIRDSNYIDNIKKRWIEFSKDNIKKQKYYSRIFSVSNMIHQIIK